LCIEFLKKGIVFYNKNLHSITVSFFREKNLGEVFYGLLEIYFYVSSADCGE